MNRLLTCVVLALLGSPAALASWQVGGSVEPDTPDDLAGYMWSAPDASPEPQVSQVYFNAIAGTYPPKNLGAAWTSAGGIGNPNLASGSRIAPPAALSAIAYLGTWKDCNGDGYIGDGASVLFVYPEALLSDTTVCPRGTVAREGSWVWEFRWIRPPRAGTPPVAHALDDPAVIVWGDVGRGEAPPQLACPSFPVPAGSTASSGGILKLVDCATAVSAAHAVSSVDPDGALGLRFDDPDHPEKDCSSALTVRFGIWSDPYRCEGDRRGVFEHSTGRPAVTVWDCSGETTRVRDPTGEPGQRGLVQPIFIDYPSNDPRQDRYVNLTDREGNVPVPYWGPVIVPKPGVALDPQGSAADSLNHTESGLHGCRGPWNSWSRFVADMSDPRTFVEVDDTAQGSGDEKRSHTFIFDYSGDANSVFRFPRGTTLTGPLVGGQPLFGPTDVPIPWTPVAESLDGTHAAGLLPTQQTAGYTWRATGVTPMAPSYRGGTLTRTGEAAPPLWLTFYARVGQATLQTATVPGTLEGTYGQTACENVFAGSRNGWDCERDHWWNPTYGTTTAGSYGEVARPGDKYQLRDVDCLDGDVAGTGVRASLADLSDEGGCPTL